MRSHSHAVDSLLRYKNVLSDPEGAQRAIYDTLEHVVPECVARELANEPIRRAMVHVKAAAKKARRVKSERKGTPYRHLRSGDYLGLKDDDAVQPPKRTTYYHVTKGYRSVVK